MAISKTRLVTWLREHDTIKNAMSSLKKDKAAVDEKIIKVLEREGTEAWEGLGMRVKYTKPEIVEYDVDAWRRLLVRKLGRADGKRAFEATTKRVMDKDKLAAALASQTIELEWLSDVSSVKESSPYITVSHTKE